MAQDWPRLDWPEWRETAQHLHLITQMLGKARLARTPWLNHSWHVALYPTASGLTTGPIPTEGPTIQLDLDLIHGKLRGTSDHGDVATIDIRPGTIADFHFDLTGIILAGGLGVDIPITPLPSELPDPIPFPEDRRERPWDADAVRRFHRALLLATRSFQRFRTGFLGKASPVHFFWGSFDLAVTRFSGRAAPRHPGGVPNLPDSVTCEAYSHEEASAGFWPGSDAFPTPVFYAYGYPAPPGYAEAAIPAPARYDGAMGEWLLDYDAVRTAPDPEAMLAGFLQATYEAAADLGGWDRAALDCPTGVPRRPRTV